MQNKKDSRISLSPTVFRLPVGRGEAAWYDDVVGGGEPGPPIAPTTAAHWRGAALSAHARAPPPCPSTVACGATTHRGLKLKKRFTNLSSDYSRCPGEKGRSCIK